MRIAALICLTAALASAQPQGIPDMRPGQQIDLQLLARAVRTMQSTAKDTVKAPAEKLLTESASLQAAGRTGEARRRLVNARALLSGRSWDQKEEFVWSLALRPGKI